MNRRQFTKQLLSIITLPFIPNIGFSFNWQNSKVKGIYVPGWKAVSKKDINKFLGIVKNTEINTLMIDVKNANGKIFYSPENELAQKIGAQIRTKHEDLRKINIKYLLQKSREKNIRLIGRHVMFRDHLLYDKLKEFRLFRNKYQKWTNIRNQKVVNYNLELLKEESKMGFDEIVLDYIRFPTTNQFGGLIEKCEIIDDIVKQASNEIRHDLDLGVQVFGYSCWHHKKAGVGQRISTLDSNVDIIYPMVYPSHFWKGSFGFKNPSKHPYEFITMSYEQAIKKIKTNTKIIPMIQGFYYSPQDIFAQIKATRDFNMPGYICWNAKGNYQKLIKGLS